MLRRSLIFVVSVLVFSSAGLACGAYRQFKATDRQTYGAAHCRVEIPKDWNDNGHVTWSGGCKDGYADGLGVLRRTVEGTSAELFLGRVDRGTLRSGVFDMGQGYMAGRWQNGSVLSSGNDDQANRNEMIAAFEEGAKAAEVISKSMARHSKVKASRFYSRLAKRLRSQMD